LRARRTASRRGRRGHAGRRLCRHAGGRLSCRCLPVRRRPSPGAWGTAMGRHRSHRPAERRRLVLRVRRPPRRSASAGALAGLMTGVDGLLYGFSVAITPVNLVACLIGVVIGTVVGILPGIGPVGAMALLLPSTFKLDPTTALIMLAGIYY